LGDLGRGELLPRDQEKNFSVFLTERPERPLQGYGNSSGVQPVVGLNPGIAARLEVVAEVLHLKTEMGSQAVAGDADEPWERAAGAGVVAVS
jgi:hypothetical protein